MNAQLKMIYDGNTDFDVFRSEVCHMYKNSSDAKFIEEIVKSHIIDDLWASKQYAKAFYLIAFVDYLSDKNNVSYFEKYDYYRIHSLKNTLYPKEILLLDKINNNDNEKYKATKTCMNHPIGKYFYRYNIIEGDFTDVI